jgi:integrase
MASLRSRTNPVTGKLEELPTVIFRVTDPDTGVKRQTSRTWPDDLPRAKRFLALLQAPGVTVEEALTLIGEYADVPRPMKRAAGGLTLVDWVSKWIEEKSRAEDKRKNRSYLKNDIEPFFGTKLLADVTDDDAQAFLNKLEAQPCRHYTGKVLTNPDGTTRYLQARTIRNIYSGVFHAALKFAVQRKKITSDPAVDVSLPGIVKKPKNILSRADFDIVRGAFFDVEYGLLIEFLIVSGMRFGEATALSARNVDVNTGRIYIERGWVSNDTPKDQRAPGESAYKLKYPKAEKCRYVFVDKAILAKLNLDRSRPFVFTNSHGGPIRQHNFLSNAWNDAMARVGDQLSTSRKVTPHNLRASYATHLMSGVGRENPELVQQQLGHAHLATTLAYYVHTSDEDKAAAAARVAAHFSAPVPVDLDAIAN